MARRPARPSLRALRERFQAQGFVVLEPWLRPAELALLRAECDAVVAAAGKAAASDGGGGGDGRPWEARERGCVFELPAACGAEHARDAAAFRAKRGDAACRLLFGARMRRLAAALLRPARRSRASRAGEAASDVSSAPSSELCLFNEQFIVKPPHSGPAAAFAWHRDGAWCLSQAAPRYMSVWVALDDVSEENGTLYVLPGSHTLPGGPAPAAPPGEADDCCGAYVATLRAGAAVVLSDAVLHASGRNLSAAPRRAWMPQYAAAPVLRGDGGGPVALAVPLR